MPRTHLPRAAAAVVLLLQARLVDAHSFARPVTLPIPVDLYLYGAAAALVLSFVVAAVFVGRVRHDSLGPHREFERPRTFGLLALIKLLSVSLLALCIVSGFYGTSNVYKNFNMTFFWVIFVLGLAWLIAVMGNLYAVLNPWKIIADAVFSLCARIGFTPKPLLNWPKSLSCWPALFLYVAFIWVELFGHNSPKGLAMLLAAYTALNAVAVVLFGRKVWFENGELFSVLFHLFGKMGFLKLEFNQPLALRYPWSACTESAKGGVALLVFVLFMLASTAYDGLHETKVWLECYFIGLQPYTVPWTGTEPIPAYLKMRKALPAWQTGWLALSPFVYVVFYLVTICSLKRLVNTDRTVMQLALDFAYSLLPIAFVYHFTHYYTLMQTDGLRVFRLLSDPLGRGWDVFGTADWFRGLVQPEPETVWHVQVSLIVIGHVISVVLAHNVAVRLFASRRTAAISQLPMLLLMVIFTTVGLWILSEPVKPL